MTAILEWDDIPEHVYDAFCERLTLVETLIDEEIDKQAKDDARRSYMERHRVTEQTIRRYIRKYKKRGPSGLLFVRSRDKAVRIESESLRGKITALVNELPTRSVPRLRAIISQDET